MIDYSLIRSKRKTISIIIKGDASIEVRAPLNMKPKEIDGFVFSKTGWIEKSIGKITALQTNNELSLGSKINCLGIERTIVSANVKKAQL